MMVFQYEKRRAESRGRAGKKPGEYPYRYDGEDGFEESSAEGVAGRRDGLTSICFSHRRWSGKVATPRSASLKPIEGSILPRKPRNLQRVSIPPPGEDQG